jgi:hypothetical protein
MVETRAQAQASTRAARRLADRAAVAEARIALAIDELPLRIRLLVLNSALRDQLRLAREQDTRQTC